MRDGATLGAAGLVVDRELSEPSVLRLRGRMGRRDAAALDASVADVLAADKGPLVIDIVDLAGDVSTIVDVLNDLAVRRIPAGSILTVRVASTGTQFAGGGLHPAIHIEPMVVTPTVLASARSLPAAKAEAPPGSQRREGRGFVASYGTGRKCAVPGCGTTLSRYNERSVCFSHVPLER